MTVVVAWVRVVKVRRARGGWKERKLVLGLQTRVHDLSLQDAAPNHRRVPLPSCWREGINECTVRWSKSENPN